MDGQICLEKCYFRFTEKSFLQYLFSVCSMAMHSPIYSNLIGGNIFASVSPTANFIHHFLYVTLLAKKLKTQCTFLNQVTICQVKCAINSVDNTCTVYINYQYSMIQFNNFQFVMYSFSEHVVSFDHYVLYI